MKTRDGLRANRLAQYRELMADGRAVAVSDLTAQLGVSEATVRRDLQALEESGLLQRTHGGAVPVQERGFEPPLSQRATLQVAQKRAIARTAAGLIHTGDTVFIGGGSTTMFLAREIRGAELTVVTNSVLVAMELADSPSIHLVMIGGTVRRPEMNTVGPQAVAAIRHYRARTTFLGVPALDAEYGFTADGDAEAATDAEFIRLGQRTVVVADHTKLGAVATTHVAPVSAIHTVVTDSDARPDVVAALETAGTHVLVAEVTT